MTRQVSEEVCCWIPTKMTLSVNVDGRLRDPCARCDKQRHTIIERNVYFMRTLKVRWSRNLISKEGLRDEPSLPRPPEAKNVKSGFDGYRKFV